MKQAIQSGVALRLPPHSKFCRPLRGLNVLFWFLVGVSLRFTPGFYARGRFAGLLLTTWVDEYGTGSNSDRVSRTLLEWLCKTGPVATAPGSDFVLRYAIEALYSQPLSAASRARCFLFVPGPGVSLRFTPGFYAAGRFAGLLLTTWVDEYGTGSNSDRVSRTLLEWLCKTGPVATAPGSDFVLRYAIEALYSQPLSPAFAGSIDIGALDPGAYAPGFMLASAPWPSGDY